MWLLLACCCCGQVVVLLLLLLFTQVTSLDLSDPTGLAVDPVGRNVYVCDKDQRRITIITADGEHRRVIVWRDMYSPVSVQLDVLEG